jgi:hypothetical protein
MSALGQKRRLKIGQSPRSTPISRQIQSRLDFTIGPKADIKTVHLLIGTMISNFQPFHERTKAPNKNPDPQAFKIRFQTNLATDVDDLIPDAPNSPVRQEAHPKLGGIDARNPLDKFPHIRVGRCYEISAIPGQYATRLYAVDSDLGSSGGFGISDEIVPDVARRGP